LTGQILLERYGMTGIDMETSVKIRHLCLVKKQSINSAGSYIKMNIHSSIDVYWPEEIIISRKGIQVSSIGDMNLNRKCEENSWKYRFTRRLMRGLKLAQPQEVYGAISIIDQNQGGLSPANAARTRLS